MLDGTHALEISFDSNSRARCAWVESIFDWFCYWLLRHPDRSLVSSCLPRFGCAASSARSALKLSRADMAAASGGEAPAKCHGEVGRARIADVLRNDRHLQPCILQQPLSQTHALVAQIFRNRDVQMLLKGLREPLFTGTGGTGKLVGVASRRPPRGTGLRAR